MIYSIDEIKKRITPVAEKYKLPAVYLFGSYARGEADEKSDVDIMIDRNGAELKGMFAFGGVYIDFEECLEKKIDLITTDGLKDSGDIRFQKNIENDKVQIYVH